MDPYETGLLYGPQAAAAMHGGSNLLAFLGTDESMHFCSQQEVIIGGWAQSDGQAGVPTDSTSYITHPHVATLLAPRCPPTWSKTTVSTVEIRFMTEFPTTSLRRASHLGSRAHRHLESAPATSPSHGPLLTLVAGD